MKLEVFEKNTRTRVDIIRVYNYVFYEDELNGHGRFEVRIPAKDHSLSWLYNYGNWILFDDGILGIIKGIKDVEDDDTEISVYGYLSNHILEFRSFLLTSVYYDTPPKIAVSMFDGLYVHPEDERRKIGFLRASTDLPAWSGKIRYQVTGKTYLDTLQEMLSPYDLGFELYPIVKNYNQQGQYANIDSFELRIIKPVDRTVGNSYGNVPVVFSFENNNLQQLEYEEDGQDFASVAIVASEGVGQDRVTLEVQNTVTELTGYERIELYVDARDLQSEQEPEPEPPEPEPPEPERFTKVEYIKNTTLTSQSLGVYLSSYPAGQQDDGNSKVEIELQCDYATHAAQNTSILFYARYVEDNQPNQYTISLPFGTYGEVTDFTKLRFGYTENTQQHLGVAQDYDVPAFNQKRKFTLNTMDNKVIVDESERSLADYMNIQRTLSKEFELFLGQSGSITYYHAKTRYYSVKLYDQNNQMVNNFYPVIENSTNKIGLYDIVTDTFVEFDSSVWETGTAIQEEQTQTTPTQSEPAQSSNEIDEKLREMMVERGKEKLESCQKFITFDASIIEGKYKYGVDFYKGDYVSVVDKNTNRIYDVQVTAVKKTYSNGVEHRDITLGTDRMKIRKLQNKRLLTLLNAQGG